MNNCKLRTVALFIPSIDIGGAERQLLELAKGLDKEKWDVMLLTNSINPLFSAEINNVSRLRVILLDKDSKILYPFRLLKTLCREKPCIITSYLLSAQLYTFIIRLFLPKTKVVFSVRDSTDYSVYYGFKGRFFKLLIERSTCLVDSYIFNSSAGRKKRSRLPDSKVQVIPNGIDTSKYYPDNMCRSFVRREVGIHNDAPVIGIVGNFSQYKDYGTFIQASHIVVGQMPDVHFVAVGNCNNALGRAMRERADELGLAPSFHFLGTRRDVRKLLPGFDVLCSSSSYAEGFSNAIAEGMACGVPCVVTDVGDSALIVGDTGIVVPPSNPDSLAEGVMKLLRMSSEERRRQGVAARARIEDNFSIMRMVAATEAVYEKLLNAGA